MLTSLHCHRDSLLSLNLGTQYSPELWGTPAGLLKLLVFLLRLFPAQQTIVFSNFKHAATRHVPR